MCIPSTLKAVTVSLSRIVNSACFLNLSTHTQAKHPSLLVLPPARLKALSQLSRANHEPSLSLNLALALRRPKLAIAGILVPFHQEQFWPSLAINPTHEACLSSLHCHRMDGEQLYDWRKDSGCYRWGHGLGELDNVVTHPFLHRFPSTRHR